MHTRTRREFIEAVFYSDIETIRCIVGRPSFDKGILEDIHIWGEKKIPVTYLTASQREIFRFPQKWAAGREWITRSHDNAESVWAFWRDELHLDMGIDYHSIADLGLMYVSGDASVSSPGKRIPTNGYHALYCMPPT